LRGQTKVIFRIIDANINRAKEGLRVCEEITRFVINSPSLTSSLKKIRHRMDRLSGYLATKKSLFAARQALSDIGKKIYVNELKRGNLRDIFFANIQRVKESIRVLEEFSKLKDRSIAAKFKRIRYDLYQLEKKILREIY
jgi:thiamine-phosphate pyrophosphorylase